MINNAAHQEESEQFEFSSENLDKAHKIIAKYPKAYQQSALMPLLDLAQRQNNNYLAPEAIEYVAKMLEIPAIRAYEVATFYTMYNLNPVGENVIEVCTTTPCWLRGSDKVVAACKKYLGIGLGETTEDGKFTLREVECLGACVNAPMMSVADKYYEDLDEHSTIRILEQLKAGETPKAGPQINRHKSAPAE